MSKFDRPYGQDDFTEDERSDLAQFDGDCEDVGNSDGPSTCDGDSLMQVQGPFDPELAENIKQAWHP